MILGPQPSPRGGWLSHWPSEFEYQMASRNATWQTYVGRGSGVVLLGCWVRILKGENGAFGGKVAICLRFFQNTWVVLGCNTMIITYCVPSITCYHFTTPTYYKLLYNWEVSFESGWRWSDMHAAKIAKMQVMHGFQGADVTNSWCCASVSWGKELLNKACSSP